MFVVLDCNIWLSLALNQQLNFISQLSNHDVDIATCDELIHEVTQVSLRPKFRKYFTPEYIRQIIIFHQIASQSFQLTDIPNIVTDEKDNYLFALCETSKAAYFVTGDKLLLDVKIYKKTQIISLADFKLVLNNPHA